MKALEEIKDMVNAELRLDINSKTRKSQYVYARTVYYRLCKEFTGYSLYSIAGVLKKNHATVLHGLKMFNRFKLQPKLYSNELKAYQKIHKQLEDIATPILKNETTSLTETIYNEKCDIEKKYKELKVKHNRMLKFFSKYEENAYEKYKV
tara:strand:- start:1543 stop:1992 length:450 start_codon:yes stop_codon:yes gene_type:complete